MNVTPAVHGGTEAEYAGPAGFIEVAYRSKTHGKVIYNGTGTLVYGNWFLTAAHVVVDKHPDTDHLLYASVSLGSVSRSEAPYRVNADRVLYYPTYEADYDGNLRDDLALLQLDPRISKGVKSVDIGPRPKVGDTIFNIGWGARELDKNGQPKHFPDTARKGIYTVTESNPAILGFVGKGSKQSIMEGDSGGPMFNENGQLVATANLRVQDPTRPNHVTGESGAIPLEFYQPWIEQAVRVYS